MVRLAGGVASAVILVAACGGSERNGSLRARTDAGTSLVPRSDAEAATPSPYPTALPPPNTPCVPPQSSDAPPPREDAAPPCFTCACAETYEVSSPPNFAWDCSATDCPDLCPAEALAPGSSEPCSTPYDTRCSYDIERCTEVCTCDGAPPSPPGFTPLQQYWLCIAHCTGCPAGPPPDGAQCWGEPEPCTYGEGASAVTCTCVLFGGEDVAYHGGQWRCSNAQADGGP